MANRFEEGPRREAGLFTIVGGKRKEPGRVSAWMTKKQPRPLGPLVKLRTPSAHAAWLAVIAVAWHLALKRTGGTRVRGARRRGRTWHGSPLRGPISRVMVTANRRKKRDQKKARDPFSSKHGSSKLEGLTLHFVAGGRGERLEVREGETGNLAFASRIYAHLGIATVHSIPSLDSPYSLAYGDPIAPDKRNMRRFPIFPFAEFEICGFRKTMDLG